MSNDRKILLSTSYFGPLSYYSKFLLPGQLLIEKHENFIKQTYRNRCIIAGANGAVALTVPVKRGSFHKMRIRDLEIDYSKEWQANHWKTIESAYSPSPFFQYYADDIKEFFSTDTRFLIDHNRQILDTILGLAGIKGEYSFTESFVDPGRPGHADYRNEIRPKNQPDDPLFRPYKYYQVFDDRHGFIPDLSILDLVFNAGPESFDILVKSMEHSLA